MMTCATPGWLRYDHWSETGSAVIIRCSWVQVGMELMQKVTIHYDLLLRFKSLLSY